MQVRPFREGDKKEVAFLIAELRVTLAGLKGKTAELDPQAASKELDEYLSLNSPLFVAELENQVVGYIICRVDGNTVWAEMMYVRPDVRRQGIATDLYSRAEKLAVSLGGSTLYNWIHPNNDAIIAFLRSRGYNVMNLIEVRKPWPGEKLGQKVKVDDHEFDY
ncbi:MAG: N-acetyltransferase family protein [Candidatus Thorarchaeota archaeon]